jgi:hypothetical protein
MIPRPAETPYGLTHLFDKGKTPASAAWYDGHTLVTAAVFRPAQGPLLRRL